MENADPSASGFKERFFEPWYDNNQDKGDGRININDYVWVCLTEKGIETYEDHYGALGFSPEPLKQVSGWSKFQLWDLMHIFGPELYNGGCQQFRENILLFSEPKESDMRK